MYWLLAPPEPKAQVSVLRRSSHLLEPRLSFISSVERLPKASFGYVGNNQKGAPPQIQSMVIAQTFHTCAVHCVPLSLCPAPGTPVTGGALLSRLANLWSALCQCWSILFLKFQGIMQSPACKKPRLLVAGFQCIYGHTPCEMHLNTCRHTVFFFVEKASFLKTVTVYFFTCRNYDKNLIIKLSVRWGLIQAIFLEDFPFHQSA